MMHLVMLVQVLLPWMVYPFKFPFHTNSHSSALQGKVISFFLEFLADISLEDMLATLSPNSFNAAELLNGKMEKTEIFTKAITELKRFEHEPLCHRTATKVLLNNCQNLEEISEENYDLLSERLQRQHVESFALSLAMCDLERIKFAIPDSCRAFGSKALNLAFESGSAGLRVSSEQVGECLEALGRDHTYWITWTSYRDKALLFCRAARIDIDKDQAIVLHQKLVKIMTEFAQGAEYEFESLRSQFANESKAVTSYFEGVMTQASSMNEKLRTTFDSFSKDLKALKDVGFFPSNLPSADGQVSGTRSVFQFRNNQTPGP